MGGNVGAKCRLTIRWFNYKYLDLDTYVGAISRPGQRLANAVAAGNPEFIIFIFDVSLASANGLTF